MKSEVLEITVDVPEELDEEIHSFMGNDNINGFIHDLIVRGLCLLNAGKDAA